MAEESSGAKTQRERQEAKRQEKLQEIEDKVRDGSLVIRQMTPEERERMAKPPKA
jgi:hypothetical protein